jgi:hypothetical protein
VYSYTVVGGTLGTTRALRITLIGDYLNNVGAQTFTLKLKFGATTVLTAATSTSAGANRGAILFTAFIAAADSASAQAISGYYSIAESAENNAGGTMAATSSTNKFLSATNTATEASASDKTLAITAQHTGSSASLSFRCHTVHVELL